MAYIIVELEVTQAVPDCMIPKHSTGLALVIRRNGRPVGFLMKELHTKSVLSSEELLKLISEEIEPQLLEENHMEERFAFSAQLLPLTIAICTRNNPQDLATCLQQLLHLRLREPEADFEILVVDNASSDSRTKELVTSFAGVRYVMEPKPGLNFARNRALREASGEIIAYIDDDVIVDQYWLRGLTKALTEHPDAAAVTGLVLPLELETEAQILFEKRGGFEKSFKTIRYGQTLPGHPFYPCVGGKFGTGCNMAFRRPALLELGGFDEALDTGTPLPGGGDTDMLYRVIRAGYPLIYEPQFLVFHKHRRGHKQLRRQYARSWGQGLMAYVVKTYKADVAQRPNLRRLVAWWFDFHLRELIESLKGKHVLAPDMVLAELWGGITGLLGAYPRSVRRTEKIRKQFSVSTSAWKCSTHTIDDLDYTGNHEEAHV